MYKNCFSHSPAISGGVGGLTPEDAANNNNNNNVDDLLLAPEPPSGAAAAAAASSSSSPGPRPLNNPSPHSPRDDQLVEWLTGLRLNQEAIQRVRRPIQLPTYL